MYALGYYPAKGSLVTSNAQVIFDPTTQYTSFRNLAIDKSGMYLLSIQIYSERREFTSQCFSNTITVSKKLASSSSSSPNYKFKFSKTNSSVTLGTNEKNQIKASIYNCMSNYNISVTGIQLSDSDSRRKRDSSSSSLVVMFFSTDSNSALSSALSSLNVSSYIVFSSATINGVTYGSSSSSSSSSSSLSLTSSISIGLIIGCVIGSIILIGLLVFGYFGLKEFKKLQMRRRTISPECWMNNKKTLSRPVSSYSKKFNNTSNDENL